MIRELGGLLAFGGCLLLGLRKTEGLREKEQNLERAAGDMEELARLLDWNGAPLTELLSRMQAREGALQPAYQRCLRELDRPDRLGFAQIWREALIACGGFSCDGLETLAEAGGLLGQFDRSRQAEGLDALGCRLRKLAAEAREERKRMGRVYCVAGGAAGLLLVIVLL